MKNRLPIGRTFSYALVVAAAAIAAGPGGAAEPLREFKNCQLIDEPWADGDSFHVRFPEVVGGSRDHVVRRYFADCPESVARTDGDAKRLREQTRYFGLRDPMQTITVGRDAKVFVQAALAEPFTVWTRFANARGRAAKPRIYGIVIVADGRSLDEVLIRNGLARDHGVRTKLPDGTTGEQQRERLIAFQTEAIMKKAGIWRYSDPMAIVSGREANLQEEQERQRFIESVHIKGDLTGLLVNPNTASPEKLQELPGIGPARANWLIENRPYERVEDLDRVPGIGAKTVEKLRPYLVFGEVK